ncbi:hypothetical protein D3C79_840170 [compost metagenome]
MPPPVCRCGPCRPPKARCVAPRRPIWPMACSSRPVLARRYPLRTPGSDQASGFQPAGSDAGPEPGIAGVARWQSPVYCRKPVLAGTRGGGADAGGCASRPAAPGPKSSHGRNVRLPASRCHGLRRPLGCRCIRTACANHSRRGRAPAASEPDQCRGRASQRPAGLDLGHRLPNAGKCVCGYSGA